MPTVSVIVPNYNHAPFLRQRIESILGQTFQDFELILLDDCSTDDTVAVVSSFSDERIRLEDRSTSTQENMKYSMEIIGNADAKVGVVTNGFHEYRAMLFAKKAGFHEPSSVPAKTLMPIGIHYTVREFFGVVSLIVRGR